jgi:sulfate/thiosulfate transport system substrate-binding protein
MMSALIKSRWRMLASVCSLASLSLLCGGCSSAHNDPTKLQLLNVSFDPTREFFQDVNTQFAAEWQAETGQRIEIKQSHGGSGSQARAVIEGLNADVVTLALSYDIDKIHQRGKRLGADWQHRLPNNSAPYTSTIVFLVRKGNPKNIRDWDDLVRDDVTVITPNPKTSGGARWNYLAAWGYALHRSLGDLSLLDNPKYATQVAAAQADAANFVADLYGHVPILDRGARAATNTFAQREIGDVLLAWESEALLAMHELRSANLEMIVPSISVLAEPSVALVDKVVDHKGTRQAAEAYLQFLYSDAGQALAAKHYFRPRDKKLLASHRQSFKALDTFTVDAVFGGWDNAQATHFADGGTFDRLYLRSSALKKPDAVVVDNTGAAP